MTKLFLGSVALVALGLGTAFAAERPVPAPAYAPPPAPVYTWNGCYVGASPGTSSGPSHHFGPAGNGITNSFALSGFLGGGQLGCNWQWGAWVFGIEGDGSAINKSGQGIELNPIPRPNTLWISETQERWFVTARGRLGLTNFWWFGDKTLVYVTGGGASAQNPTPPKAPPPSRLRRPTQRAAPAAVGPWVAALNPRGGAAGRSRASSSTPPSPLSELPPARRSARRTSFRATSRSRTISGAR